MRTWRKSLGLVAGGLVGLGGWISSAQAQYPPMGGMPPAMGAPGGGMAMAPGGGMPPGMGMPYGAMPPMGGMPPSMGPTGMPSGGDGGNFTPGAFNSYTPGAPADFPNPSQGETAAPLSIKDDGLPNAFSDLIDPRHRLPEQFCVTVNGQYVGWHITNGQTNAALVTTTNNNQAVNGNFGALGQSNTNVLVGPANNTIDYHTMDGYKLTMGFAFGYHPPLEISGFFFNRQTTIFSGGSSDATGQLIARPVDALDLGVAPGVGTQTALLINVPGALNGNMQINSAMSLWSVEANFICMFCDTDCFNLAAIVGYRHLDMYENLNITSTTGGNVNTINAVTFDGVSQPPGSSVTIVDNFRTRNFFDGGQLGLRSVINLFEKVNIFTDLKVGLGNTHQELDINGNTTLNTGVATAGQQVLKGGLLALPSNIGQYSQDRFGFVPEVDVSLSYQIHPHIRLFVGYNLMYWNSVIRPGDYLSNAVDSRTIPTAGTFVPNTQGIAPGIPSLVTRSLLATGYHVGFEIGF